MEFNAYDGALHRIERLQRASRIATAICGLSRDQADTLIKSLSDNRGSLEVVWHFEPTDIQRNAFSVAWEQCRESAEKVSHTLSQ